MSRTLLFIDILSKTYCYNRIKFNKISISKVIFSGVDKLANRLKTALSQNLCFTYLS